MQILAIDPGPIKSAYVVYDTDRNEILDRRIALNEEVLRVVSFNRGEIHYDRGCTVVIEYPHPRGQPMYTQLVDTIRWIGRFEQAHKELATLEFGDKLAKCWIQVDRKDVKMMMCGSTKAKDSNIRAAVLSRFSGSKGLGGGRQPEIGTSKQPGPLFGISSDLWSALALALTWKDMLYLS